MPWRRSHPPKRRPAARYPTTQTPLPITPSAFVSPGTLRGDARLAIQTKQAQRLVHGRRHSNDTPGIIGLVQFGNLMRRIWTAAGADDPYADWALLRVHEALDAGRTIIAALNAKVETLLQARTGVSIQIAHSLQPIDVPLQFANPYGYMGAYLIADFDTLVRGVLTARHVGLLARDGCGTYAQHSGGCRAQRVCPRNRLEILRRDPQRHAAVHTTRRTGSANDGRSAARHTGRHAPCGTCTGDPHTGSATGGAARITRCAENARE